ncbi:conserved Plasmodium protein, unknown function [Plasmodium malariae]|uniref:Uncharacterized protein n=1 Tax=Plasmodium malariae TaxID=5858 RepID=A0A1C3KEY3_PLAMA|nr:conserved Plasmodium protein, unknown function [Plasmodium malariae]
MDSFIDDEINNSASENEPVLLNIDDLLHLKKSKKKSKNNRYTNYQYGSHTFRKIEEQDMNDNAHEFLLHKEENFKIPNKENTSMGSSKWYIYYTSVCSKMKNFFEKLINKLKNIFINKKREENFFYYSSNVSSDFLNILANRLYYSRVTAYLYFLVILLNVFILIYTIFTKILSKFIVASEMFVILMLFLEISLRLTTQGSNYFYHFDGLFDVTVTTMCLLLLVSSGDIKVFYENDIVKTANNEMEEIVSQTLTMLRFSFQLFRTVTFFMHYRRTKAPTDNIDFSLLNLSAEDP